MLYRESLNKDKLLAKTKYSFEKRQKELAKKKKREEKMQHKLEKQKNSSDLDVEPTPQLQLPPDTNQL